MESGNRVDFLNPTFSEPPATVPVPETKLFSLTRPGHSSEEVELVARTDTVNQCPHDQWSKSARRLDSAKRPRLQMVSSGVHRQRPELRSPETLAFLLLGQSYVNVPRGI